MISLDLMHDLGSNFGTTRVSGIGLLYTELVQGIPSIFMQFLLTGSSFYHRFYPYSSTRRKVHVSKSFHERLLYVSV